ncbi:MAG: epoxyqueuosine reductase [Candidatus Thorarchaeota archaeon]|jgi:epoxyqueuosine reductase
MSLDGVILLLTKEVKRRALEAGFVSIGIADSNLLKHLQYGWVGEVRELYRPEAELASVKSVIVLAFNTWDRAYSLTIDSPSWRNNGYQAPESRFAYVSLGYEVIKNRAWTVVEFLRNEGFEAKWSVDIPLKTTAVLCGLGCQGKSSLLITPDYGPRVFLIAILTSAELKKDGPFEEDLCKNCERCIKACPTNAIDPYRPRIEHCMIYYLECPESSKVPESVREKTRNLIKRPTSSSYIECTRCIDVCPIGSPRKSPLSERESNDVWS